METYVALWLPLLCLFVVRVVVTRKTIKEDMFLFIQLAQFPQISSKDSLNLVEGASPFVSVDDLHLPAVGGTVVH